MQLKFACIYYMKTLNWSKFKFMAFEKVFMLSNSIKIHKISIELQINDQEKATVTSWIVNENTTYYSKHVKHGGKLLKDSDSTSDLLKWLYLIWWMKTGFSLKLQIKMKQLYFV